MWSCSTCTYQNQDARTLCEMCGANKPAVSAAPTRAASTKFVPNPGMVNQLMSMGFDKQMAEKALKHTNNDESKAAEWLLTQPPPASATPSKNSKKKSSSSSSKGSGKVSAYVAKEKVDALAPLGFDPVKMLNALHAAKGDVERATDMLMLAEDLPNVYTESDLTASSSKGKPKKPSSKKASTTSAPSPVVKKLSKEELAAQKREAEKYEELRKKLEEEEREKKVAEAKAEMERQREAVRRMKEERERVAKEEAYQRLREQQEREKKASEEKERRRQEKLAKENELKDIPTALRYIRGHYNVARYQTLCSMVVKIISKILENPSVEKFRTLRVTNETFQKKIGRPMGGLLILRCLGFREADPDTYVMDSVNTSLLKEELARFKGLIAKTGTCVPEIVSKMEGKVDEENLFFGLMDIAHYFANVLTGHDTSKDFRRIDKSSIPYLRVSKLKGFMKILNEFGFEDDKDSGFLVVEKVDVAKFEAGLVEVRQLLTRHGSSTPIASALRNLVKDNDPNSVAKLVGMIETVIQRILSNPGEEKYHSIKLGAVFKRTGKILGGSDFVALFGFEVDEISQKAYFPSVQLFDLDLLKRRNNDLDRVWSSIRASLRDD